jgi:hypothetical protein
MTFNRVREERGAIIIHVAIALVALLAFLSIVVDYGMMWVSRRQAQSAADAGALAGAVSLMQEGDTPTAKLSAGQFASENPIWGQANSYDGAATGNVDVAVSGTGAGETSLPPCGTNRGCVRVDIFRNETDRNGALRGNPLPVFFARLIGLTEQGVRATATAQTASGNNVKCLLPFAVADRWSDSTDENVDTSTFLHDGDHLPPTSDPIAGWSPNDKYQDTAEGGTDTYVPPGLPGSTSWTVDGDYGRQLVLKKGAVGQFSAGWANAVDLPGSVGGSNYLQDIKGCNNTVVGIAKAGETCAGYPTAGTTPEEALAGCLGTESGLMVGPTEHGIDGGGQPVFDDEGNLLGGVVEQDPRGAHWDPSAIGPDGHQGAVVDDNGALNMGSPQIRPIAVFDIAHYMQNPSCVNQAGTGCVVRVANIIGFFVEGMCPDLASANRLDPGIHCSPNPAGKNEVIGRIVTLPGAFADGVGTVPEDNAFIKVIRLVR